MGMSLIPITNDAAKALMQIDNAAAQLAPLSRSERKCLATLMPLKGSKRKQFHYQDLFLMHNGKAPYKEVSLCQNLSL